MSSLLRADPTRTVSLRRWMQNEILKRMKALKESIVRMIEERDALGIKGYQVSPEQYWPNLFDRMILGIDGTATYKSTSTPKTNSRQSKPGTYLSQESLTGNRDWAYDTNPRKVERFRAWLREQMKSTLVGDALIQSYIEQGYRKGASRAFNDLRRGQGKDSPLRALHRAGTSILEGDDAYTRGFLNRGATVEKVKLLASRTFSELEDVNARMATKMSRILVDGLVNGHSPDKIAKEMTSQVDIETSRALMIARTELVRAHSEGTLDVISRETGEDSEITASVEWHISADSKTCPKCKQLDGKIYTVKKARGVIPVHPNCRCVWVPVMKRKGG